MSDMRIIFFLFCPVLCPRSPVLSLSSLLCPDFPLALQTWDRLWTAMTRVVPGVCLTRLTSPEREMWYQSFHSDNHQDLTCVFPFISVWSDPPVNCVTAPLAVTGHVSKLCQHVRHQQWARHRHPSPPAAGQHGSQAQDGSCPQVRSLSIFLLYLNQVSFSSSVSSLH